MFEISNCTLSNLNSQDALKLINFYTANKSFEELFSIFYQHLPFTLKEVSEFKIPPISHHIWLTQPYEPLEIHEDNIANLNNTITIIDSSSTTKWQHIFGQIAKLVFQKL